MFPSVLHPLDFWYQPACRKNRNHAVCDIRFLKNGRAGETILNDCPVISIRVLLNLFKIIVSGLLVVGAMIQVIIGAIYLWRAFVAMVGFCEVNGVM